MDKFISNKSLGIKIKIKFIIFICCVKVFWSKEYSNCRNFATIEEICQFFPRLKSFASFEKISTFSTFSSKVEISSKMENEEISSKPVFTMGKTLDKNGFEEKMEKVEISSKLEISTFPLFLKTVKNFNLD